LIEKTRKLEQYFDIKDQLIMKKSWILPLAFALIGLASCAGGDSGTALTTANASNYLTLDAGLGDTPSQNADGSYTCHFYLNTTKYGLSADVKGSASFTVTPTEHRLIAKNGEASYQKMTAINGVTGDFVATSSTGSDGGAYYLSCKGTFTVTITLDSGFDELSSATVSDFAYTAISGSVING
jgi:hypothetical protein